MSTSKSMHITSNSIGKMCCKCTPNPKNSSPLYPAITTYIKAPAVPAWQRQPPIKNTCPLKLKTRTIAELLARSTPFDIQTVIQALLSYNFIFYSQVFFQLSLASCPPAYISPCYSVFHHPFPTRLPIDFRTFLTEEIVIVSWLPSTFTQLIK